MASDFHVSYELIKSYVPEEKVYASYEDWYEEAVKEIENISIRHPETTNEEGGIEFGKLQNRFPGWGSNIQKQLKDALKHRFNNQDGSWRCFDKVIGEYRISVDDRKVIVQKIATLGRILDILNSIPALTTKDPNPPKEKMIISQDEDLEVDEIIERAIIYSTVNQKGKIALGGVMGYISQNHPTLKSELKELAPKIRNLIESNLEIIEADGISAYEEKYKRLFGEVRSDSNEIQKDEDIKLEYYFPTGDYDPESVLYEIGDEGGEGSIKLASIIRMVKEERAKNELNEIRPKGPMWPQSASGIYTVVISNGACAVATKSTGRPWSSSSCERMNGPYPQGPYSDINWGNCIAYIFEGDKVPNGFPQTYDSTLLGRTLMRWGNADQTDRVAVGLENRIYPSDRDRGPKLAQAIMLILRDNGLLDYKKVTTPYRYKGWGDTQGTNNQQLTYSLRGMRVEGKEVSLEEGVIGIELALASSPTISYSDVLRLSRVRNDIRVRRQLAQNPSIFLNLDAVQRLLRSRDVEITKFIASSIMAEPELLMSIATQVYEKDVVTGDYYYDVMNTRTHSVINTILNNPNTPSEAHDYLFQNHPGYIANFQGSPINDWEMEYKGSKTKPIYALIHYLGWDPATKSIGIARKFMCPAPTSLLGELIDMAHHISFNTKGNFSIMEYPEEGNNRIYYGGDDIGRLRRDVDNPRLLRAEIKNEKLDLAFYSQILSYLLYAPHMNLYNYKKIIRDYMSVLKRRQRTLFKEDILDIMPVTMTKVEQMITNIWVSFSIPMTEVDDWGFRAGQDLTKIIIPTSIVGEGWRTITTNFDRQQVGVLEELLDINTDAFVGSIVGERLFNEGGFYTQLVMSNLRDIPCVEYLWSNRKKYGLLSDAFFLAPRDMKNPEIATTRSAISDTILFNAFQDAEPDRKYFIKYNFPETLRTELPRAITNLILDDVELCKEIGMDVVAMWLVEPQAQFERFESILLKLALRDLWTEGLFQPVPDDLMDLFEQTQDFNYLELAAIGDGNKTGLVRNPRLPESLQTSLLEDWVEISNMYEGNYGQNMKAIEEPLALNPNTSEQYLTRFAEKPSLRLKVAQNTNTSQLLLSGGQSKHEQTRGLSNSLYYEFPVEVLQNAGLSQFAFDTLWDRTIEILKTEVFVDAERLFNLFKRSGENLLGYRKGKEFRSNIRNILGSAEWLEYWRGGYIKAGSFSPYTRRNLWLEVPDAIGGITDYPIPIMGKKSVVVFYDSQKKGKENDAWKTNRMIFIEECGGLPEDVEFNSQSVGEYTMNIRGSKLYWNDTHQEWVTEEFDGDYAIDEYFEYIVENQRSVDVPTYTVTYPEGDAPQRTFTDKDELYEEELEKLRYVLRTINETDDIEEETLMNYVIEGVTPAPRWKKENIFMFTDKDPPQSDINVPDWRYTWDVNKLKAILGTYVQRKDCVNLLLEWKNEPYTVRTEQQGRQRDAGSFDLNMVIKTLDAQNSWTEPLVDFCLPELLQNDANLLYNSRNVPLTPKLLAATLSYDNEWIESGKLTRRDLERAQSKILAYPEVPSSYIYDVYLVTTSENVLQQANLARLKNPISYNQYYAQLTQHSD